MAVVRTRFAPSPTGFLHIGSARTALFSWLYSRHHGGKFILRIEDTDRQRSTQVSVQAIREALEWLGIDYDEGPFFQSERLERYHEIADQLLRQGHAYHCYCTKAELAALRDEQIRRGEKPHYNRRCRTRKKSHTNTTPTLRFKTPIEGSVSFTDQIHGEITVENNELDDLVLLRSDGVPTYHFSVVIDDMDMHITHIIRGDDHISNTPRQIHLWRAIDDTVPKPEYAHVPMILDASGKRLSKREGAVSVINYRDQGYLPEALCNYLVRLGWGHGDQEIFSRDEMIAYFDFRHIGKNPASLNPEKLDWLNRHYLQAAAPASMIALFTRHLKQAGYIAEEVQLTKNAFEILCTRHNNLHEMAANAGFIYEMPEFSEDSVKTLTSEKKAWLKSLHRQLSMEPGWTKETVRIALDRALSDCKISLKQLGPVVRFALTGGASSPDLITTIWLIGYTGSLERLHRMINLIESCSVLSAAPQIE